MSRPGFAAADLYIRRARTLRRARRAAFLADLGPLLAITAALALAAALEVLR